MTTKGASTCKAPSCNKTMKAAAKPTKINRKINRCWAPLNLPKSRIGIANKINNEASIATTPKSFFSSESALALKEVDCI